MAQGYYEYSVDWQLSQLDIPDWAFENAVVRGMEEAANDIITVSNCELGNRSTDLY